MKARVILADPPWEYNNRHESRSDGVKTTFGIGVASRYSHGVLSRDAMCRIPIHTLASDDALLFMWTTWPTIKDAFIVMDSWGFDYITCAFVWVKTCPREKKIFKGPGRYTFSNSEPCLLGRRKGKPRLWYPNTASRPSQIVLEDHPRDPESRKIIHSRKPHSVHESIESWLGPWVGDHKMLEVFATQKRQGWVTLGGAIDGVDIFDSIQSTSQDWSADTSSTSALILKEDCE